MAPYRGDRGDHVDGNRRPVVELEEMVGRYMRGARTPFVAAWEKQVSSDFILRKKVLVDPP
jgi:hypothetical protein